MASNYSIRDWYSEEKVKSIQIPQLSTWRSRYDLKDQLRLTETDDLVIRNLRYSDLVPIQTSEDTIHEITPAEDRRPDIIAYNYYGDARMAWIILSANGYSDFMDFEKGTTIRIPSITALYGAGGIMMR